MLVLTRKLMEKLSSATTSASRSSGWKGAGPTGDRRPARGRGRPGRTRPRTAGAARSAVRQQRIHAAPAQRHGRAQAIHHSRLMEPIADAADGLDESPASPSFFRRLLMWTSIVRSRTIASSPMAASISS